MAKVDNYQLIQKINNLEGLTTDEKSKLIDLLNHSKPYGLVWEEKHESVEDRFVDELPVLEEVAERRIISENAESPNHIIIEGDNLHALTTLAYTHENSIDVIYIDPPYNTGNKDFVYNDSFVDREDNYRHSKWLSFMHKRLTIAKTLLSEKGVIFISIDDNEQANLKLLCDEIFGEGNFLTNITWKSKSGGANDASHFGVDHEYILVYAQNTNICTIYNDKDATVTTSYNKVDENGNRYALDRLDKQSLGYQSSLDFPIIGPDGREYVVEHKNPNNKKARWRWGKSTVEERYNELVFIYPYVYTKNYEKNDGQKPRSILFDERFGRTRTGSTDLKKILTQSIFSYPKPVSLINYLLQISSSKDATILDFFAGSGTTLHAVMKLNEDDKGKRKCILVTNNENGICESVTYVRNKNIIRGYTDSNKQKVIGLINNNLRYYKTDFVGRERNNTNMRKLVESATDMLCIKNDIYEEQDTFFGNKHSKEILRFFDDGKKMMLIIYLEDAIEDLVEIIDNQDLGGKKIITYVFSPSNDPYTDDFFDVEDKVKLVALPSAIYNAYSKIWSKRRIERLKKIIDEIREEKKDNEVSEPQLSLDFENNNTDNQQ